jgi:hypothetical protein
MPSVFIRTLATATAGFALAIATAARADIVVLAGADTAGTETVLLDGGVLDPNVSGTGATTGGELNFVASENVFATTSGQLAIVANDGAMTGLSVFAAAPSNLLTKFLVNVNAVADGTVTLTVYEPNSDVNSFNFSVAGNGENFFTITAVNGQKINRIDMTGAFGTQFADFRLMRATFEGLPPDTGGIPEPATWAMLILGFAGVGSRLRRRVGRAAA